MSASGENDYLVYSPTPSLPEVFLDLDLMLMTAADADARSSALVAGTREVLSRFEHLADTRVFCASAKSVIADMSLTVHRLNTLGGNRIAQWLTTEVVDLLTAHQELHDRCIDELRSTQEMGISDVAEAASSIQAAAEHLSRRRFAPFPIGDGTGWNYDVKLGVLAAMSAELRRNPLRKQLDGAGGAAGSAEFNPYIRAMFELELVTHRRIYRVLYSLAEHVGVELREDKLFQSPEVIEHQQF